MKKNKLYVYKYDKNFTLIEIYTSTNMAAQANGVSATSIYKALKGDRNLAAGFFWHKGTQPLTEIPAKWIDFLNADFENNSKSVRQYNLDGELIAEYVSIRQAAKAMNVDERSISLAASGKLKTSRKHIWKFVDSEK